MGRTVSGTELLAGQHEFAYNKNRILVDMLAQGNSAIKEIKNKALTVKESLISKTATQLRRLSLSKEMEKLFENFAGKTASTEKIFNKVIARTARTEEVASL